MTPDLESQSPRQESTMQTVLHINELLTMILFGLPTRELLLSQRVCKTWKTVIEGTDKLQEALFFKNIWSQPVNSRFLSVSDTSPGLWEDYVVNPLLVPLMEQLDGRYDVGQTLLCGPSPSINLHASWRYSKASWRRMLVTQPAAEQIVILLTTPLPDCGAVGGEHGPDREREWYRIHAPEYTWCRSRDYMVRPDRRPGYYITGHKILMGEVMDALEDVMESLDGHFASCDILPVGQADLGMTHSLVENSQLNEIMETRDDVGTL